MAARNNQKQFSKDDTKKRLMSTYQVKSSLKENPTLRYNMDLHFKKTRSSIQAPKKVELKKPVITIQREDKTPPITNNAANVVAA